MGRRAWEQRSCLLLVVGSCLLAARGSSPNGDRDMARIFTPNGCPANARRSLHNNFPPALGPDSGQKIIVMGLPKMGTTSVSQALRMLGYVVSHNEPQRDRLEGSRPDDVCVEAIANVFTDQFMLLDERHPEATWVLVYAGKFETWWLSASRWWRLYCVPGKHRMGGTFNALFSTFTTEHAGGVFRQDLSNGSAVQEELAEGWHSFHNRNTGEACPGLLERAHVMSFMKKAYHAYHQALSCFFENKPHVEIDVRQDHDSIWQRLGDFTRNGTNAQPLNVNQPFVDARPSAKRHTANNEQSTLGVEGCQCTKRMCGHDVPMPPRPLIAEPPPG